MKYGLTRCASALALAVGISSWAAATAQESDAIQTSGPQESGGPQGSREVVVVTASKREETVQDLAVAVTAITSQARDELGLTTVQDYTNFAPGLDYSASNDRLGMRGISRATNNFGIRSGISNYVDGVYFSSAIPASRESIFTERVEVVRGPQGTLYGRDSIGGALNVITKRPTEEFEGQFNIGVESREGRRMELTMAGPINDNLRYRVGGSRTIVDEGYLTNVSGLETEGGHNDGYYLEGQLEGNLFGDRFEWWTRLGSLQWERKGLPGGRTSGDGQSPYDTRYAPPGSIAPNMYFAFAPGVGNTNIQQTGDVRVNFAIDDPRLFNTDKTQVAFLKPTTEGVFEAVWHADQFDIKYLGGYVHYNYNLQGENDGSPVQSFFNPLLGTVASAREFDYNENRGWYSNEINIVSTGDGAFNWILGLYQYEEDYTQPVYSFTTSGPNLPYFSGATGTGIAPPMADGRNTQSQPPQAISLQTITSNVGLNQAYGAFMQGDYQFNDQWKLTAGIRYSEDRAKTTEFGRLMCPNFCAPGLNVDLTRAIWSGVTTDPSTGLPVPTPGVQFTTPTNPAGTYIDPVSGHQVRLMKDVWDEITGTLGLDYTPDADTLIYGKWTRGFKPGGFGAASVGTNFNPRPRVDEEILDSYELGFKRTWYPNDTYLTTNVVLFYYDYEGYQVPNTVVPPVGPAFSAFVNLPKVESLGLEIENVWEATDNLSFILNYAYLDPEIKESPALVNSIDPFQNDAEAQPLAGGGETLAGYILPNTPKNKAAFNARYRFDLEGGGTITPSVSYFWQDIAYTSIFNRFYNKVPSWDQVDARLTYRSADGTWTLIGFVRNVFDERQFDSATAGLRRGNNQNVVTQACGTSPATTVDHSGANFLGSLAQNCYTTNVTLRPPRTFGAELQFRF